MDGFIDELNQAFLTVDLGQGPLDFQIDTGFNGSFVIGTAMLDPHRLELDYGSRTVRLIRNPTW